MTTSLDAFAEVERLIIIAAHPDDMETLCGGTVWQLIQRGVTVFSVNCTLGNIGSSDPTFTRESLARVRLKETETAGEKLGIERVFSLGRDDGELIPDLELRAEVARLYRLTQADTLWTFDPFWAGQAHPDHTAAGQAALDAYMPSKMPLYRAEQLREAGVEVGCIERVFLFSTDREPDIYVDVTAVYPHKIAAAVAHQSQFPGGEDNLDWMKKRDREAGETIGVEYAEVFKQMNVW